MAHIYKDNGRGNVFELKNLGARGPDDVHVFVPLDQASQDSYFALKGQGLSDSGIWRAIHAGDIDAMDRRNQTHSTCELALDDLSKRQIVKLIESLTTQPLPGLTRAPRESLLALLRHLSPAGALSIRVNQN